MKETNTLNDYRRAVPNYLLIQKAKEDYVQIYNFYESHDELLKDETVRGLYMSLMGVDSLKQLRQWMDDISKSSLSLGNTKPYEGYGKWENILGHYDWFLRKMMPNDLETLALEMPKIREFGFDLYFNRGMAMLCFEASRVREEKSEVIAILYDQIDNHVAVGEDAVRLYEMFGWQTATASLGNEQMSVMPICDDILLTSGLFDFQLAETMVDLMDIRVDDPLEAELSIAQQTIDAFRREFPQDLLFPADGLRHYSIEHCIEHEHSYPFIEKSGDTLTLVRSDATYETVVSDQSWNVSRERIPLLTDLAEYLHMLMHDKQMQSKVVGESGRVWCELQSRAVIDEYMERKTFHKSRRLLMDHASFYEAYGDDAVSLAKELHRPLWSRYVTNDGDVPMLMLSPDMADVAMSLYDDVEEFKAHSVDELMSMRIRPSFLNEYLRLDEVFKNESLLVKKDGGYAVRASQKGRALPMKDIPREMGERYMAMPEGLAKRIYLNGILHSAYKDAAGKSKKEDQSINIHNS